jgi:hypothetical protein
MTNATTNLDFNTAGEQRTLEVIPTGTICTLQLTIKKGGAGPDGWLKRSSSAKGDSEGLNCEFVVVDGPYAKRKLWQLYTLHGTALSHAEAGEISRGALRAILESAKGINPKDVSEAAQAARNITSWGDLDQIRFVARLGVKPAEGNYAAKNVILEIVTPDRHTWTKPTQIDPSAKTTSNGGTTAGSSSAPPAGAIGRPQWAG